MNKRQIIASLGNISNQLDNINLYKEANTLTNVMMKLAQEETNTFNIRSNQDENYPEMIMQHLFEDKLWPMIPRQFEREDHPIHKFSGSDKIRWVLKQMRDLLSKVQFDEEYVEYTKSKFGAIDLVYDPTMEMLVGETYSTTLSASWNIPEDTSNYEMDLRTQIEFYASYGDGGSYWNNYMSWQDHCDWEGVETVEQAPTVDNQTEQSRLTLSLGNSYSGLLSISSIVFAAFMARRR